MVQSGHPLQQRSTTIENLKDPIPQASRGDLERDQTDRGKAAASAQTRLVD